MKYSCQCCGHVGMEAPEWEICAKCDWQNDISLSDADGEYVDVNCNLSEGERRMWSSLNYSTPNDWLKKWIEKSNS